MTTRRNSFIDEVMVIPKYMETLWRENREEAERMDRECIETMERRNVEWEETDQRYRRFQQGYGWSRSWDEPLPKQSDTLWIPGKDDQWVRPRFSLQSHREKEDPDFRRLTRYRRLLQNAGIDPEL